MESLQKTCIPVLVNLIEESKIKSYAKLIDGLPSGEKYKYQITPEPSNRIFEILTKGPLRFSSETANDISKVLNVTKVTLTSPIVNDASIDLLRSFNLVELRLLNLKDERTEDHRHGYKKSFFDIIAALDSILNSKSLKSVRVLKIDGDHTEFNYDWIDQIANVLGPVLQHLDISSCQFFWNQSTTIFTRFPNLIELDVSYTQIRLADGISQLKNLEKLSLAGIRLDNDDFTELFKLRKLQFLNLSGCYRGRFTDFMNFSFHEKSPLPELKVLDISADGYDLVLIVRLVEVYPKLETIGLIGYQFPPNTNISGVKLLMNTTVEQCLESLDYYLNTWGFQHKTIAMIIEKINQESERAGRFMIKCLGKIIEAIDHGAKFTTDFEPLATLTTLIDEHRLRRITPSQRHSLARYLLALQPHDGQMFHYFRLFQQCFTSDAFLATPHINYSMICNKTIDLVLREVTEEDYDRREAPRMRDYNRQHALEMGVSILSKCLHKMARSDETFRKKRIDGLLIFLMTGSDQRSRQAALAILVHVLSFSSNRSMTKHQKARLKTEIMSCINRYRQDSSIHIENFQHFLQTKRTSSGVKDWFDWVKMCGDMGC
ncbi:hypothetical protein GCK72_003949 [Caenorhabditis remanei]|uniref:Uncharacterized protein n=1 Tax=Caenorhabditis remanei TaxID=31234 RepID=A0A6A5HCB3_CAERE|nr:hypothetical protein GCK72_003949 [Caenorhabditis remanei]KAF1764003.1 hypothetical protein GCK72_003949 [Caenorhabditis remanei]